MQILSMLRAVSIGILLALSVSFAAPSASAADPQIDAAISQGIVGEKVDGFLGLVKGSAPADIERKVNEINAKRRALYQQLASETGTTLQQVGVVTGEKQIEKLPSGAYYMNTSGQWVKK